MSNKEEDMNGLGPAEKIVDMGDLYGNPLPKENTPDTDDIDLDLDDFELSDEEEEALKAKLERIRKADPFIYR
jgi:hypothetical protein